MDVTSYSARLHRDLGAIAGDEETLAVAERLAEALDSSLRLVLLDAMVEAAGEISEQLAPGSVEVRLLGRDVQFAVTSAVAPVTPAPVADDVEDGGTARLSLRLPERLKPKVEQAAAAAGVSVNAWLVRAISSLVDAPAPAPTQIQTMTGQRHTGWAR